MLEEAIARFWTHLICHRVIGEQEQTAVSTVAVVCKRCKARNEVEMEETEVKRV